MRKSVLNMSTRCIKTSINQCLMSSNGHWRNKVVLYVAALARDPHENIICLQRTKIGIHEFYRINSREFV